MQNELKPGDPLSPVVAVMVATVPAIPAVVIRLDFLTSPMQRDDEAHPGRNYALTPAEARLLAQRILEAADKLGEHPPPGAAESH